MAVQDWVALVSAGVAILALIDVFHARSQSSAREDGKTAEILREVDAKLKDIADQARDTGRKIEDMDKRLVKVEESTKSAHKRIDEIVGDK